MKNLSKIFLLIISLGNFIYPSYKDKPLPKLPKEHHRPDQSKPLPPLPNFLIIRFESTGNKKVDKEFETMLTDKAPKFNLGVTLYFLDKNYKLTDFTRNVRLNQDIIIPINFKNSELKQIGFIIGEKDKLGNWIKTYLYNNLRYDPLAVGPRMIEEGNRYIFRYKKCGDAELKDPDNKFIELPLEDMYGDDPFIIEQYGPNPLKNAELGFCVEIQNIAQQQKKLKEELEQALPDMPGDLRNIIQGYVGTDIT